MMSAGKIFLSRLLGEVRQAQKKADLERAEEELVKSVKGEQRADHKYNRREPLPGGGWRYFYDEDGAEKHHDHEDPGHEIHARHEHLDEDNKGDKEDDTGSRPADHAPEIEHTGEIPPAPAGVPDPAYILGLDNDGGVHVQLEGQPPEIIDADKWNKALLKRYGAQTDGTGTASAATMVLRLVDSKLLEDLEANSDAERLALLARRNPDVLKKIEGDIERALVGGAPARAAVAHVLGQKEWSAEGRAELIGEVLGKNGLFVTEHHRELCQAAKNLAGGEVQASHVASVLALRISGYDHDSGEDGFPEEVAKVGEEAEKSIAHLQGLLKIAKKDPSRAPEVLAQALALGSVAKLHALAKAYPGFKDDTAAEIETTIAQVSSLEPRVHIKGYGAETGVFVAGENGNPERVKAKWRLIEASELVASHNPGTFAPNTLYPAGLQERAYHRDKSEQAKVELGAQNLKPELLLNTNPDATNGPPVVTREGIALGGNSRSMMLQLSYQRGKGEAYKKHLEDKARDFGFKPEDVQALVNPVLVREVEIADNSAGNLKKMVRQLNENFTQALDPKTMMAAMSRKLEDGHLEEVAAGMKEGETLAAYLDSSRSKSFRALLEKAGVIDRRNRNAYVDQSTGRLNEDGKRMVERIIVGKVVDDADLLANTPSSLLSSLARSAPHLVQAEQHGNGYNVRGSLRKALAAYQQIKNLAASGVINMPTSKVSSDQYNATLRHLDAQLPVFGNRPEAFGDPVSMALLETLIRRPGVNQMAGVFQSVAKAASHNGEGNVSLFGDTKKPGEVIVEAITSSFDQEHREEARARAKWEEFNRPKAEKPEPKEEEEKESKADDGGAGEKPKENKAQASLF